MDLVDVQSQIIRDSAVSTEIGETLEMIAVRGMTVRNLSKRTIHTNFYQFSHSLPLRLFIPN